MSEQLLSTKPPCLAPNCGTISGNRGLCASCYRTASYLVKEGKVTWDILEARGKALPRRKAGGLSTRAQWFLDGLGDSDSQALGDSFDSTTKDRLKQST